MLKEYAHFSQPHVNSALKTLRRSNVFYDTFKKNKNDVSSLCSLAVTALSEISTPELPGSHVLFTV